MLLFTLDHMTGFYFVLTCITSFLSQTYPTERSYLFYHCQNFTIADDLSKFSGFHLAVDLDHTMASGLGHALVHHIPTIISSFRSQSKSFVSVNNRTRVLSHIPQAITTVITERVPSNDGHYGQAVKKGWKLSIDKTCYAQIDNCFMTVYRKLSALDSGCQSMCTPRLPTLSKLPDNLVPIAKQQPPLTQTSLPSIYMHNIRSLNHQKFAELKTIAQNHDIIVLTESWLTTCKEQLYAIDGFSLLACHRKNRIGGGVAIYVRDCIPVTKLAEYTNSEVSALWFLVKQQGHSPIVFGGIYSPPNLRKQQADSTINHIITTIAKNIKKHKSAKIVLCGDFNDLDTTEIINLYPLDQIVNFATREQNMLDLIFTDMEEYKAVGCTQEPPISTNDHCAVVLQSTVRIQPPKYNTIKKRDVTPKAKIALTQELAAQSWNELYDTTDIDRKVGILHTTVNQILEKHCPIRSKRVPVGKPYITSPLIEKLKRAKKTAHKKGNPVWKFLAKQLTNMQKQALHQKTDQKINNAIHGTKTWWNNIRQLTGESHKTKSD